MESAGFSKRDFELFSIEEEDIATAEESGRYVASTILPLFLIAMLGTGAFYAALDTVVGERERRTLETMLVSPLLRGQILLGKYVFVVLSGCVALVLNLLSLSLFLQLLMSVLETEEPIRIVFSPGSVAVIIGAAILTAGLFAAIMMVLVIPSKTYREGQATLTPLTLLVLFPSVIAAVSREPFDLRQASIPLVNAASLFESALLGDLPVRPTAVTFLVLLAMTGLALALAARIVSREDIFLEPRVTLRELFVWKGAAR
jgi:sodium transport system permease protein